MKPTEFIKSCDVWDYFKTEVLPYITDEKSTIEFKEYILPKIMNDSEIQNNTKSTPIDVKYVASFIQQFVLNADKNKYYIIHCQLKDKVVALDLSWDVGEWFLGACDFGIDDWWVEDGVFLYPATPLETVSNDTLTLEQMIGKVVMAGYTVTKNK